MYMYLILFFFDRRFLIELVVYKLTEGKVLVGVKIDSSCVIYELFYRLE